MDSVSQVVSDPEIAILISCARIAAGRNEEQQLESLLKKHLDWNLLSNLATRHSIKPLLYLSLRAMSPQIAPRTFMDDLQNFYLMNTGHNMFLARELLALLHLLQSNGVRAIPYKGPAVAMLIHENLSFRQFGDLDVLIHPGDVGKAKTSLIQGGFRCEVPLTPAQERSVLANQGSCNFIRGDVLLDLHWGVGPKCFLLPFDFDMLWSRLTRVSMDGATIGTLCPEDTLLMSCMENAIDGWERLLKICDVAGLIRVHTKMDWDQVIHQASRHSTKRILFTGLDLASYLLGVELPARVQTLIHQDSRVRPLTATILKRLFDENERIFHMESHFKPVYIQMRERQIDRIRYFTRMLLTPNVGEWQLVQLPDRLSFLYYAIRPVRLAAKYTMRIGRALVR